ncbi:hypothetical protein WD019_20600 [Fictibacillus sp. Mic-4]|uniref:hypothetical protein n=1 Tax=Fictibacillus TaxID=1329200 RepID=UPI00040AD546|nr:hypothetical protein [Fictibacillus gelatini]
MASPDLIRKSYDECASLRRFRFDYANQKIIFFTAEKMADGRSSLPKVDVETD